MPWAWAIPWAWAMLWAWAMHGAMGGAGDQRWRHGFVLRAVDGADWHEVWRFGHHEPWAMPWAWAMLWPTGTRTSAVGAISSMSTGPWTALEPVGAGAYGSYSSSCEAVGQDWAANLSCLKCGKSMLPDSLYCRHCGHKRDTPVGYDLANGLSGLNGAPVPPPLGLDTPNKTFDTQIFPTQPALDPPGSKRLSPHRVVYTGHGLDVQAPLPPSRLGT
ncbi:unnamed protein product, partial [Effrenium voratum]